MAAAISSVFEIPGLRLLAAVPLLGWGLPSASGELTPAGIRFHDVSSQRGILDYTMTGWIGGGVSAGDYDDDGDIDLFVPTAHGVPHQLYRNRGDGVFDEVADQFGLDSMDSGRVALWFDYDGDHRLDLLVLGDYADFGEDPANMAVSLLELYQQQADGAFIEVAGTVGLEDGWLRARRTPIGGVCAGDLNNDEYLDLCIGFAGGSSRLIMNDAGVLFRTVAGPSDGVSASYFQPLMLDFNRDGLLDIYQAIDYGPNRLWINQGDETFADRAAEFGVAHAENDMGVAVGDCNNDRRLDIFVSNIAKNVLYQNAGSEKAVPFLEVAGSAPIEDTGWGWGCTFFDADCDGWQDLAVTNGWDFWPDDASRFFRNTGVEGSGRFVDQSTASGFSDKLWGCTLLAADVDRDGDQDLVQTIHAHEDAPSILRLLENRPAEGDHYGHWLTVRPRTGGANHFAIGAVVQVRIGNMTMTRPITAGISFLGQEPAEAFFGLGEASQVDEVTIQWPGGGSTIYPGVLADQVLMLQRPDIPTLAFRWHEGRESIEFHWDYGTLQRWDDGSGMWSDVAGAVSPWTVTLTDGTPRRGIFRLIYEGLDQE